MTAQIMLPNDTAPATPPTGYSTIYTKADGLFYTKDDAGVETALGGGGGSGTVTEVSGTAPIQVATGTTAPVVSITAATPSLPGSMSAADKTKLDAISGTNTGDNAANSSITPTSLGLVIGTNVQAYDADLTTWAGITPGAGVATFLATPTVANFNLALSDADVATGGGTATGTNTGDNAANSSITPTSLGLVIGTNVQAYDADLTTWAGITPGTDVATALAVAVGTAGAVILNGGALGTPLSGTLTNATGLPAAGVTGTALVAAAIGTTVQAYDADLTTWAGVTPGTGVTAALVQDINAQGALVTNGGALGTPSSGTLTNATGLPPAGVTGTALVTAAIGTTVQAYDADLTTWAGVTPGTGVATALGVAVGTAGAPVVNGGDLGTPSSGVLTNTTGYTQAPGDNSTKLATTAFVSNAVAGLVFKDAVIYATTAALPAVTYANGTLGVGATLTADANGALAIDSAAPTASQRILVKNQAADLQNGIYTVTDAGSAGTVFILTRATDNDQSAEFITGFQVLTTAGTANTNTTWTYNGTSSPTMGTTSLTFAQSSGVNSYTAGNGLTLAASQFAIDTAVTVDKTTAQTLTNKTLASPTITGTATGSISGNAGTVTGLAVTAGQTLTVTTGGTIGSAAYTASTAYATTAQGATADAALPSASFTAASVTGKLITGFVSGAGTVAATDTILEALNKLDGNVAGKQAAGSYQPLATVLTDTTAAFTTAQATKLSNLTPTTALTVNTGTVTLVGNVANTSSLTLPAGALTLGTAAAAATGDFATATQGSNADTHAGLSTTAHGGIVASTDARLTDARTPTAHAHGNVTNTGYIGSTATLPIITGTAGILQAGSFGATAGTFCAGDDARLADSRNAATATIVADATNVTFYPTFVSAVTGNIPIKVDGNLTYNPATNTFTAGVFAGAGTSLTGTAASLSIGGNAATATSLAGTLAVANGGTGITSFGTGIATALGVNVGTAGSFVVNGGALGTPSSGTLTNCTLPLYTAAYGSAVARTFTAKNSDIISVLDFGANTTPGTTDMRTAFYNALVAGDDILIPAGNYRIASALTVTTAKTLRFASGAYLTVDSGITVTVNGYVVAPTEANIFRGSGTVTGISEVWPAWFGAVGDWNGSTGTDDQAALTRCTTSIAGSASSVNRKNLVHLGRKVYCLASPWVINMTATLGISIQGEGSLLGEGSGLLALTSFSYTNGGVIAIEGNVTTSFSMSGFAIERAAAGTGYGLTINFAGQTNFLQGMNLSEFSDLTIANFSTGIQVNRARLLSWHRVFVWCDGITASTTYGVHIRDLLSGTGSGCGDMTWTECQFVSHYAAGVSNYGVFMTASTSNGLYGIRFDKCIFYAAKYNIWVDAANNGTIVDLWITDCQFDGPQGTGIYLNQAGASSTGCLSDVHIKGCFFTSVADSFIVGVAAYASHLSAITITDCFGVTTASAAGIIMSATSTLNIANNVWSDVGNGTNAGIAVDNGLKTNIIGNNFGPAYQGTGTGSFTYAVSITGASSDWVVVQGNNSGGQATTAAVYDGMSLTNKSITGNI